MFFVGIFGVDQAQKPIGTCNNAICPACGALTRFEVFKSYSYFHIFFIPAFRWNIRYFVRSSCCNGISELDPAIGHQYEKGWNPEIRNEHLRPLDLYPPYKTCPACGARSDSSFSYCPYCGNKL